MAEVLVLYEADDKVGLWSILKRHVPGLQLCVKAERQIDRPALLDAAIRHLYWNRR